MNTWSKEIILQKARELGVKFVRLQFTDILGIIKNVAIPYSQLERALENEIMFDGSSIEGFTRIEESDMNLRPVISSFAIFPWRPKRNGVARLICDVYSPKGEPFAGDPRYVLKKVLAEAEESGYTIKIGPECEFFLFKLNEEGKPTNLTQDEGGYFDMGPVDKGEDARRDIILALEEMGIEIMASHHEVAQGQHEVDLWFDDPLLTADQVTTYKFVTRAVASKNGLCATFMPKPIVGINGSGMHTHFSIYDHLGRNIFYDPRGKYHLSEVALHFIGGLIQHAPAITAISNPLVNSYKRLIPGYEAPIYISWSGMNRSALVRIPASRVEDTRVEFRSPDPACNPYLAFAVMIKAGMEGIKNKIEPPESVDGNVYEMNQEERKAAGIRRLPANLMEALEELKRDELIRSVLGEHIYSHFMKAKRIEWELYQRGVHQWELDQYLGVF